ncbi:uncharacterized protein LOC141678968 [Apium graveolens]|uniref:uncharacterized protein LOC141678968 n=1 Tax=Apium graveolens TaxID=4045 RepID=UPI003D78D7C7
MIMLNSGIEGLVNSLEQSLHHDPRLADQISHAGIQRLLHILMGIDNHVEGLEIINIQVLSVGILSRRRLHQHSRTRKKQRKLKLKIGVKKVQAECKTGDTHRVVW